MARRKGMTTHQTKGGDSVILVQPPTAPVRRSGGRRRASSAPKKKHRRRSSAANGGGSYKARMMGTALGGAIFGFLVKQFPNLPTIPLLGKSGTVAVGCYFFGGSHPIVRDVGIAASAIAGYTLGGTGTIEGYFGDDHGLASQT